MDGWISLEECTEAIEQKNTTAAREHPHSRHLWKTACHGSQRWTMTFFIIIEKSSERSSSNGFVEAVYTE
jgi:hypothetical protein